MSMSNHHLAIETAVRELRASGHSVERTDFPPPPLPGLWNVDGRELTELQLVQMHARMPALRAPMTGRDPELALERQPVAWIVHDDPELGDYLTRSRQTAERSDYGCTPLYPGERQIPAKIPAADGPDSAKP